MVIEAALREVVEVEIGVDKRFVGEHRAQIGEPVVLRELALLHVVGKRNHVEARIARIEFDDRLLPLLLLRDHLRADADACQVLEFLVILGQQVTARALHQKYFDLLALEPFPVERACALSLHQRGIGEASQCRGACAGLQQAAARSIEAVIAR